MEPLPTRSAVTTLAPAAGVLSVLAVQLRRREGKENLARRMHAAGCVFVGIGMPLFVMYGLRGQG